MNIGFAAILIVLTLTQGIFFREAYFSGPFSKRFIASRSLQEMASVVLYSIILHVGFLFLIPRYKDLEFGLLMDLASDQHYVDIVYWCREHLDLLLDYFVFTSLWALWLGLFCQKLVRYFKLDRRHLVLRFANQWHYLLNGEVLDFPGKHRRKYHLGSEVNDFILADLLIEFAGISHLYSGRLINHTLGKDGSLESITLTHPFRIKRKDYDSDQPVKLIPIPGEYMIFRPETIINYNFTYLSLGPKKRSRLFWKRLVRYFQHPTIALVLLLTLWFQHEWFVGVLKAMLEWMI